MEDALDKITKLLGGDLTLSTNANAARMPNHLQIGGKSLIGKILSREDHKYQSVHCSSPSSSTLSSKRKLFAHCAPRRPYVQLQRVECLHAPSFSCQPKSSKDSNIVLPKIPCVIIIIIIMIIIIMINLQIGHLVISSGHT